MQKTVTPIDNTIYVEREYHSDKIEQTIDNSMKAQKTWAELEVKERVRLLANFVKDFLSKGDLISEELTRQVGRPISQTKSELNGFKERADYMLSIAEKKLENININDIPYESKILALNTSEYVKSKAVEKLKEINVDLKKLVNDDNYLSKFLIQEIKDINNGLIDKIKLRKSTINISDDYDLNINIDEFTEIEHFNVLVTKDNQLKKVKDYSEDNQDKDSSIKNFIPISSNHKLLLFLSSGKVLTLDPNVLPGGKASPKSYIELINVGVDEKLIGVFNANTQKKLLLISKFGKGFISISEKMTTNQKKGKNIINLKNNDELLNVHFLENKYLALVSKNEKLLVFDTSSLPTLNKGAGVLLMKIKDKDFIVDSSLFDLKQGLSWSKVSKTKNLKDVQFWLGKRAQVGKKIPKGFNKNLKFRS